MLLAWQGYPLAYAVDAVLFTASLYASIRLPQLLPMGEIHRPGWRSVLDGLRYIATGPVLLMSFVVDIIAMVFALPRALIPQAVAERFDGSPIALGWLSAGMAIGAVLGALGSGWLGRVRRQGVALTVTIAVWGLSVAAAGLAQQLWLMVVLMAVGGVADIGVVGLAAVHPAVARPRRDARADAGRSWWSWRAARAWATCGPASPPYGSG